MGEPAMRKKKCSECEQWFPATTEFFYATTSRGRKTNQYGEPFLRSQCRKCKIEKHREWSKQTQRRRAPEERERYAKMQRARRRAYQRLAKLNEEGFKYLYADELRKEGIVLDHYVGPTLRDKTDYERLKGREGETT